jgi:hypothetical protein
MRFACGDVRDHIVSYKNDHRFSYRPWRALQQWRRLKIAFREIFEFVRFSTFATVSANNGSSQHPPRLGYHGHFRLYSRSGRRFGLLLFQKSQKSLTGFCVQFLGIQRPIIIWICGSETLLSGRTRCRRMAGCDAGTFAGRGIERPADAGAHRRHAGLEPERRAGVDPSRKDHHWGRRRKLARDRWRKQTVIATSDYLGGRSSPESHAAIDGSFSGSI